MNRTEEMVLKASMETVSALVEQLKARCDAQEKTIAAQAALIAHLQGTPPVMDRRGRRWPFLSSGLGSRR